MEDRQAGSTLAKGKTMDEQPLPLGYISFPFDVPSYFTSERYTEAIMAAYKLGYNPIVCEPHIIDVGSKMLRLSMARRIIEVCDAILVFHEDMMTSMMIRELLHAKENGKLVITINFVKGNTDE